MPEKKLSVVVPCFNEEKIIYENLKKIGEYLKPRFEAFEIIAVNDGSSDKTLTELQKIQKEIPLEIIDNKTNMGKGRAVRDGVMASSHELVMFLDADLGIPVEELEKFVAEFANGWDMVIASRFVPGFKVKREVLWYRKFMEKVFRLLRILITNDWNVKDTQCGFKVFRRKVALDVFSRLTVKRFAFDAELIFVANRRGYRIKELPITLQNPPESHVRFFRDPLNMTADLVKIRVNDWRGKYDNDQ